MLYAKSPLPTALADWQTGRLGVEPPGFRGASAGAGAAAGVGAGSSEMGSTPWTCRSLAVGNSGVSLHQKGLLGLVWGCFGLLWVGLDWFGMDWNGLGRIPFTQKGFKSHHSNDGTCHLLKGNQAIPMGNKALGGFPSATTHKRFPWETRNMPALFKSLSPWSGP